MSAARGHVIALCGGVGGAKLAFGLSRALAPGELTLIVNTGDDFEHLGLFISPDIDTVLYTLSGRADRARGWGLAGETWAFMEALRDLGGEAWFQLGDRDLATHVERTRLLRGGASLSETTRRLAGALGLSHAIAPMSDDPVRTIVDTADGPLAFQHYFVREQCRPAARAIRYEGAERAHLSPAFAAALARDDVSAVIVCPSNPYLSIDPILALPGVRASLAALSAPIVAVSPFVGGKALKGPAAKLARELGGEPSNAAIAAHYAGLIDGLVIDRQDQADAAPLAKDGVAALATESVMRDDAGRERLARETLAFAASLRVR